MIIRTIFALMVSAVPLCCFAILPPQEKSSPVEVLQYRNQKKAEYRAERENYEQRMVKSRTQVMAEMKTTPWKTGGDPSVRVRTPLSETYKNEIIKNDKRMPLIIAVLIIINVLCVFGIKKMNRFGRAGAE